MNKIDAVVHLEKLAMEAESENYHEFCSFFDEAASLVENVTERTIFVLPQLFGGLEVIAINP